MTNEELVDEIQSGRNVRENLGLLYEQNERLIIKLVQPYSEFCELDDLKQEAYIGLQKAAERYDGISSAFSTYAGYWIRQSAQRYVENTGTSKRIPVITRQRIRKVSRFRDQFRMMNGGAEPSDDEICSALELTAGQLERLRKADAESHMISVDSPIGENDDGGFFGDLIADERDQIGETLEGVARTAAGAVLWDEVAALPAKRREVIRERYLKDLTRDQVGEEMNLTPERVRQIEQKALETLRKKERIKALRDVYDLYPGAYGGGVQSFKRTHTSSTEQAVFKHMEMENKLMRETERAAADDKAIQVALNSGDRVLIGYAKTAVLFGITLGQVIEIMNTRKTAPA